MVPKLLRRLAGRSPSPSREGETPAGQNLGIERWDQMGPVGNPLPSSWVRMYVWRRDHGRCVQCGGQERVWFDYRVPVREGGSNTEQNIRLLCEPCRRRNTGASVWKKRWRS
jgi:hypothetical protein